MSAQPPLACTGIGTRTYDYRDPGYAPARRCPRDVVQACLVDYIRVQSG